MLIEKLHPTNIILILFLLLTHPDLDLINLNIVVIPQLLPIINNLQNLVRFTNLILLDLRLFYPFIPDYLLIEAVVVIIVDLYL